jgi:hypothetical protein
MRTSRPVWHANNAKVVSMSIAKRDDAAAIDQSTGEITADSIRVLMRDVSTATMREISSLIMDLETLRDRLQADGSRFERGILEHATLSKSVIRLANIASKSMVDLKKAPQTPSDAAPSMNDKVN